MLVIASCNFVNLSGVCAMRRETFNLIRPLVLKAVGIVVAAVILPPAVILGILRKGWSGFFSVPFRALPPALICDSRWGTHRYGTGIQVPLALSVSQCRLDPVSVDLHFCIANENLDAI